MPREIHDELGQNLTVVNRTLSNLIKRYPTKGEEFVEQIQSTINLVKTSLKVVRRISGELRPASLDKLGLISAIEWQVKVLEKRTGLHFMVTFEPEDLQLPESFSTPIYRIFQEAFTNIIRHTNATHVIVSLEKINDHLVLKVKDNGQGITRCQISSSDGYGLLGIRERVNLLRGSFNISGIPNKGTVLQIEVPLNGSVSKSEVRV